MLRVSFLCGPPASWMLALGFSNGKLKGRTLFGTPRGLYCLFRIADLIKHSASALWKAVEIGSEMMGFIKCGWTVRDG